MINWAAGPTFPDCANRIISMNREYKNIIGFAV